jgi:hypothetical protein
MNNQSALLSLHWFVATHGHQTVDHEIESIYLIVEQNELLLFYFNGFFNQNFFELSEC